MATASLTPVISKGAASRPATSRAFTAPPEGMSVNGHFASVGQNGTASFEHGVQVIDEDKEFKYACPSPH